MFQIGDRVVRINSHNSPSLQVGDEAVIVGFDSYDELFCEVLLKNGRRQQCLMANLELEHIYNSPLNQALR